MIVRRNIKCFKYGLIWSFMIQLTWLRILHLVRFMMYEVNLIYIQTQVTIIGQQVTKLRVSLIFIIVKRDTK